MVESLRMFVFLVQFKSKYRRKPRDRDGARLGHLLGGAALCTVLLFLVQCAPKAEAAAVEQKQQKCSTENCHNGVCKNDTCVCEDGWQGPECQFCGGKVRLAKPSGYIHDGLGNYSIGVKCSWLIDAREYGGAGPGGVQSTGNWGSSASNSRSSSGGNATIRLHLEEFATECGWDHLYVYDGDSVDSPLLAVFSGLMYKPEADYAVRRVPELVARSGSALLHFFSDDAYNMSGFNISYRIDSCPSRDSAVNCSGRGVCNSGTCLCEPGWLGSACDQPICPGDCSVHLNQGICDREHRRCMCSKGYRGSDCSQHSALGWWRALRPKDFAPPGSAGHGAVVWKDSMHAVAGESYGAGGGAAGGGAGAVGVAMYTYDFNGNVWETQHTESSQHVPRPRYGASTVIYGDKIFMYGGVLAKQQTSSHNLNNNNLDNKQSRHSHHNNNLNNNNNNRQQHKKQHSGKTDRDSEGAKATSEEEHEVIEGGGYGMGSEGVSKNDRIGTQNNDNNNNNNNNDGGYYYNNGFVGGYHDGIVGGACNELWAYDVSAKTWENITVRSEQNCDHSYGMCGPLKSAGHTATLITSYDIKKSESMIVIFGHSPRFGYLNTVQEFNFGTREWKILETRGYPVKGGYGHTASYDYLTEKIYVYGGIISESESNQYLTSKLYSYEPKSRTWMLLKSAPSARFLHTANFVSQGLMLVFGGNTHNDTSHSFGAKCYSNELLAYDVLCDSWHELEIPKELHADLARFGHSAVFFEGALYIYGGFNGQMLSDMLKYTPGDCTKLPTQYDCLNTRPGMKCVWDMKKLKCSTVGDVPVDFLTNNYYEELDYEMHYQLCPEESRMTKAHSILWKNEKCAKFEDCQSCLENSYDCLWCTQQQNSHPHKVSGSGGGGGYCTREKCTRDQKLSGRAASHHDGSSDWSMMSNNNRRQIEKSEQCPEDRTPACRQLHTCNACRASRGRCSWDYETPKCRAVENRTVVAVDIQPAVGGPMMTMGVGSGSGEPVAVARSQLDDGRDANHPSLDHHHQHRTPATHRGGGAGVVATLPLLGGGGADSAEQQQQAPPPPPPPCAPSCAELASCQNCTQEECIWCQNEGRCVDKNAYTASFPYGQCREWTTVTSRCRSAVSGKSLCSYYSTCRQCRDEPACGWCDDGSGTGLGRCLPGGARGPHGGGGVVSGLAGEGVAGAAGEDGDGTDNDDVVPEAQGLCRPGGWHFTRCPSCQCNGHSTCLPSGGDSASSDALSSLNTLPGGVGPPDDPLLAPSDSGASGLGSETAADLLTSDVTTGGGGGAGVCRQPCRDPAVTGAHCDRCRPGYWGDPVNGGKCKPCECNGQATQCNSETGKCYCTTKGLAGDHCEKCDTNNHYHEDSNNKGSCYYDLTIDYQFTFNLSKKEDRHYTRINFRNSPIKPDIDADFTITCSVLAKMDIAVKSIRTNSIGAAGSNSGSGGGSNSGLTHDKTVFQNMNCTQFRHKFSKAEYAFGTEDNATLTTFYVSVYDFRPPLWIQISFSQYPKLNLQQFFITFSTCFLLLLLVAAIMWKIKQKWDMYRRRQRLFVEMEQMASRPFSQVLVEIESKEALSISQITNNITTASKRKKDSPSPIALEPCHGNRAAVLSLLVRLPTGGQHYTRSGQSAGLAIASALVTLGNPRKSSLDQQNQLNNTTSNKDCGVTMVAGKGKRKGQSQHPADSCI